MKKSDKFRPLVFIVCILAVFATGSLGSFFTDNEVNSDWYESIKPNISPPNYVFGIVWPTLYLLIAISIYLVWNSSDKKNKKILMLLFAFNLILNASWTIIFFGNKMISEALYVLIFIWLSTLILIFYTFRINRKSSYLLIPYLIWLTFAGILNYLAYLKSTIL